MIVIDCVTECVIMIIYSSKMVNNLYAVNFSVRLVTVDNVSVGPCGAYPAWLSGLPAGRIKEDRRSG